MRIVGYSDKWNVTAGQEITFFVSSEAPQFRYSLVRFGHDFGQLDHHGPAEIAVDSICGNCIGVSQPILAGSSVRIDNLPRLDTFTFTIWLWPTLDKPEEQCFAGRAAPNESTGGWRVGINAEGRVFCAVGRHTITSETVPLLRQWTFVAVSVGGGMLHLEVKSQFPFAANAWSSSQTLPIGMYADAESAPLVIGAASLIAMGRTFATEKAYNGKVSSPAIFDSVLTHGELLMAFDGDERLTMTALARWDFAAGAETTRVSDMTGHGFHGHSHNRPGRLVTGHNYTGRFIDPSAAPAEYNAAHFHDDDLADAGWLPSFSLTIPADLKSGVYAAKIVTADGDTDYLPFAVSPPKGVASAKVAVLLPTLSYMVYANIGFVIPEELAANLPVPKNRVEQAYCRTHRLLSLYDYHNDGSGVSMAGMFRPVPVNFRPNFEGAATGSAHQLSADLQLLDWLEARVIDYDVITDHQLHFSGAAALKQYNVVLSGTHAEYWSAGMLDGLEEYQNAGGRFVYLSGNGLYWVTAVSEDGSVVEVRRYQGTRAWSAMSAGEMHLSLSGEPGGLWRHRGRPPQKLVGVGFAAQGWGKGRPFVRQPESYDPRVAFIFDGIDDAVIGDFPALVLQHGAAGFEIDRADSALGTPSHALVVATAWGFSDEYQNAVEEVEAMAAGAYGGAACERVRADMVFYETPNGGAVFSASAISFCSTLSFNKYENNISRLLDNVVRNFSKDEPLLINVTKDMDIE